MSAVQRSVRTASKALRFPPSANPQRLVRPVTGAAKLGAPSRSAFVAGATAASRTLNTSSFSTMASLQSSGTPMPQEGRGYDPEITDIADYVHNKPVDSELAVSPSSSRLPRPLAT